MSSYFESLLKHYNVEPDDRKWAHVPCPRCFSPAAERYGDTHFSFNHKAGYCFVCGYKCTLPELIEEVGAELTGNSTSYRYQERKKRWMDYEVNRQTLNDMIVKWNKEPYGFHRWNLYKPISEKVYSFYKLGFGMYPDKSSLCKHNRLMVPLIAGEEIVGVRGRRLDCDCPKWAAISGSKFVLYNGGMLIGGLGNSKLKLGNSLLTYNKSSVLYIVENQIDSLLLLQKGIYAVATLGVTIWEEEWTKILQDVKPSKVVVAYDNDMAGCPNEETYQRIKKERLAKGIPFVKEPNGYELVKRLREKSINAFCYHWSPNTPEKMDIGKLLTT